MSDRRSHPPLGAGIGLRAKHVSHLLDNKPDIKWCELLVDNWLVGGGLLRAQFEAITSLCPVAFHGVALSLGGSDPIDYLYLEKIRSLMSEYDIVWYSEHAAITSINGVEFHDLLPLPANDESIKHLGKRIRDVQDFLGQQILIENVSSYIQFNESDLSEGSF